MWSEWGDMSKYTGSGFYGYYWMSEGDGRGRHYFVYQYHGAVNYNFDSTSNYVACRQGL